MSDADREFVRGLTDPRFDGIGTSTLRSWRRYWEAVRDGRQPPNPGDNRSMATEHIGMIRREIETREERGYAGPDRDRSWRTGLI